jgi:transcriptional regulator with XRE-family HTH domain
MPHQRTSSRAHSTYTLTLGAAVRELRACRVISQEELAFRAKLHRNYVGALERGEINPTFKTLRTLAGGLDVELSSLIRLYEERQEDRLLDPAAHDPSVRRGEPAVVGPRLRSSCR